MVSFRDKWAQKGWERGPLGYRYGRDPDAESSGRTTLSELDHLLADWKPEAFDVRSKFATTAGGPRDTRTAPTDPERGHPVGRPRGDPEAVQAQNFEFGPVVDHAQLGTRTPCAQPMLSPRRSR